MSTPIATPTDLELYLGLPTGSIDTARATLLLSLAQNECEAIVTPLPLTANGVVLAVAERAYNNVTSAHQLRVGSASVSYGSLNTNMGIGGLYLSRTDKSMLRLLAGRGSAFSANTLPTGANEVQSVTVAATSGTFTLAFNAAVTGALAFNASAATVQTALLALSTIGAGNVAVTGSYLVTFTGLLATTPLPLLVADGTGLAGGTVAVAEVTQGVYGPGQNLMPWDYDYAPNTLLPGSTVYP